MEERKKIMTKKRIQVRQVANLFYGRREGIDKAKGFGASTRAEHREGSRELRDRCRALLRWLLLDILFLAFLDEVFSDTAAEASKGNGYFYTRKWVPSSVFLWRNFATWRQKREGRGDLTRTKEFFFEKKSQSRHILRRKKRSLNRHI